MPPARWFGFVIVWVGLGFLTTDMLRQTRNQPRSKKMKQDCYIEVRKRLHD
jgi:hypothetical protein